MKLWVKYYNPNSRHWDQMWFHTESARESFVKALWRNYPHMTVPPRLFTETMEEQAR